MMAEPKLTRQQIADDDFKLLFEDKHFRRFLSTVREIAGIERVAYGPEERHLHFAEGRRSLWCDILRTAERIAGPDAILRILADEMETLKGTSNGRRNYDRLRIDDGSDVPSGGARTRASARRDPSPDPDGTYLDYGAAALVE